jgi:type IV pilus assembly protein PilC
MQIFSRISVQERVDFTKNLSVMLKSGIAINDALATLATDIGSPRFREVLVRVRTDIENGTMLAQAFGKEVQVFGAVFVSLIRAGEESGTLEKNLSFLAEWLERHADLRREVSAATMYPKLVFGASVALGGSLAVFILPRLVPMFRDLRVELPLITKMLLAISLFIQDYWHLIAVTAVLAALGARALMRVAAIERAVHTLELRLPLVGAMLREYQLALISRLFATLLKSGFTLNDATPIVREATTNIRYRESIDHVASSLLKGTAFSKSIEGMPALFPRLVANVTAVGEQSGTLADSFHYLAEHYDKEVRSQTKRLPILVEPILLVLIALVVGFIALAIIMPIYTLTSNLSR